VDDVVDLLTWGSAPAWSAGAAVELPEAPAAAAAAVRQHLDGGRAGTWLLFWDPMLGAPPADVVARLISGRVGDAWHGGLALGTAGLPAEHDYIHPSHPFVLDPALDVEAVSWRLALAACLIRTEAYEAVGGIDGAFHNVTGAGLALGRQLIERGGVVRSCPDLVSVPGARVEPLDEHDRFLFLDRNFGAKWVRYAGVRRALATKHPVRTFRGWRAAERTHATRPAPIAGLVVREPVPYDDQASVSVILPTLGRYELLAPLLQQLVDQSVVPHEILVIDQNDPEKRDHALYESFADRGVRVIWQEQRGQWISRNAAVQESTGEWLAFIDDDSEIEPDFIAAHLEGLARYDADLTTGASLAVVGAPVPENYAFHRVADQWDSGNGLCRRSLFAEVGLFDEQFDRQRRGDAEFGLRVQLHGGLVVHVPDGIRIHLKAEEGGLRTYGQWDGFRNKNRSGPLPVPSMLYYMDRYHTPRQAREDLMLGLVHGIVPYHLKRRTTPAQWARFLAIELLHVRSTVERVRRSRALAREMVAAGPRIQALRPPESAR